MEGLLGAIGSIPAYDRAISLVLACKLMGVLIFFG
jgi:hypothetical protein